MLRLKSRDIRFTRWLFRLYLVVLFLAPLPLGSNRPLFWSLLVAAAALIALAWSLGWLAGVARWPAAMRRARWPLIALLSFVGWAGLQLLPGGWVPEWLAPTYLVEAFGLAGGEIRLSADAQASADAVLLSLGLTLMAALTILLVVAQRHLQRLG